MAHLLLPTIALRKSYLEVLEEFEASGEGTQLFTVSAPEELEAYILYTEQRRAGLVPRKVPQTIFWFVEGERILGYCSLRHRLNKRLRRSGGHIGYAIRPSERGKGHAREMLRQVLEEAKRIGKKQVLLTCDETNIASQKVIEANGGILTKKKLLESGKVKYYYRIILEV